jgi:hypothetical protein
MSETAYNGPSPLDSPLPQLDGVVARICGEVKPISSVYRLLPQPEEALEQGLFEFYSDKLQSRLILFDGDGNTARNHEALREKAVKLFEEIAIGGDVLLVVPESAKSLTTLLPLLATDVDSSYAVFNKLGRGLGELESAGYGLPPQGRVLGQFALVTDQGSTESELFFVPPYQLEPNRTFEAVAQDIASTLAAAAVSPLVQSASIEALQRGKHGV